MVRGVDGKYQRHNAPTHSEHIECSQAVRRTAGWQVCPQQRFSFGELCHRRTLSDAAWTAAETTLAVRARGGYGRHLLWQMLPDSQRRCLSKGCGLHRPYSTSGGSVVGGVGLPMQRQWHRVPPKTLCQSPDTPSGKRLSEIPFQSRSPVTRSESELAG